MILRRVTMGLVLLSGMLALPPGAARAAEPCFCLAHPSGAIFRYGCRDLPIQNGDSTLTRCLDETRWGDETIEDPAAFTTVPAGEGACNPCRPPPNDKRPEPVPRPADIVDTGPGPDDQP